MKLHHLTFFLLAAIALAGCSDSPQKKMPPKDAIDNGVDWILSEKIDKSPNDPGKLFEAYTITKYTLETKDTVKSHVFEFEATSAVRPGGSRTLPEGGSTLRHAIADDQDAEGGPAETQKFTGTFTLVKKGDAWTLEKTAH